MFSRPCNGENRSNISRDISIESGSVGSTVSFRPQLFAYGESRRHNKQNGMNLAAVAFDALDHSMILFVVEPLGITKRVDQADV